MRTRRPGPAPIARSAFAGFCFPPAAIGTTNVTPVEVVTDQAATYPIVLEELLPSAWHRTDRYANNRVEADHGRLKAQLGPMRRFKQDRSARVVIAAQLATVRRGPVRAEKRRSGQFVL